MMDDTYTGKLNAWSLGWMYAAWKLRALTVLPEVNLISNIGYGEGATHTRKIDQFAELPVEEMTFPLRHPKKIACQVEADLHFFDMEIKELRDRKACRQSPDQEACRPGRCSIRRRRGGSRLQDRSTCRCCPR